MLLIDNLYKDALLSPFKNENVSDLTVVTGYSDPQMVSRHFRDLDEDRFKLKLFVGMHDTNHRKHHLYRRLMTDKYSGRFECYYATRTEKVHSKVYQWGNSEKNDICFIGSANYSQNGLINIVQKELLYRLPPEVNETINNYVGPIINGAVLCTEPAADELIGSRGKPPDPEPAQGFGELPTLRNGKSIQLPPRNGLPGVRISQLESRTVTTLGEISALNWGQREERANKDEAYIRVPTDAHRMDFFPPKGHTFIIRDIDDEDEIFIAVRVSGEYGKGINSTEDNSLIGKYFKKKLGVPFGKPITLQDLEKYGKTYVDFYKVDEEDFLIEF